MSRVYITALLKNKPAKQITFQHKWDQLLKIGCFDKNISTSSWWDSSNHLFSTLIVSGSLKYEHVIYQEWTKCYNKQKKTWYKINDKQNV